MTLETLIIRILGDTKNAEQALGRVHARTTELGGLLTRLAPVLGFGAIAYGIVKNTSESQSAIAQLEATIKSTQGAAGRTSQQLQNMASSLQRVTTFGDDATIGAEALLLTFTNIRGEVFDRTVPAMQDLAQKMGGGPEGLHSAAIQLGKALNDPVKGISALTRVGVSFSQGQKDVIAQMVKTGDVAGAQAVILSELEREFGGSAKAARETLGGALAAISNSWGDSLEVSRNSSAGIVGALNYIADSIPSVRSAIDEFFTGLQIRAAQLPVYFAKVALNWQILSDAFRDRFGLAVDDSAWRRAFDNLHNLTIGAKGVVDELFAGGSKGNGLAGLPDTMSDTATATEKAAASFKTLADRIADAMAAERESALDARAKRRLSLVRMALGVTSIDARSGLAAGVPATGDLAIRQRAAQAQLLAAGVPGGRFATTLTPQARGTTGKVGPSGLDSVVTHLKSFGSAIGGILSALNPWKFLLEAVQRALGDFLASMTPIVELLASALMPILEALFPVFKLLAIAATYVGQIFFNVAGGVALAIGHLVEGIGKFINWILPGNPANGLVKAGRAISDLGSGFIDAAGALASARDKIKELEWQSGKAADAVGSLATGTENLPAWFRVQRAVYGATSPGYGSVPGGGSSSAVVDSSVHVGTAQITVVSSGPNESAKDLALKVVRGLRELRQSGRTTELDVMMAEAPA